MEWECSRQTNPPKKLIDAYLKGTVTISRELGGHRAVLAVYTLHTVVTLRAFKSACFTAWYLMKIKHCMGPWHPTPHPSPPPIMVSPPTPSPLKPLVGLFLAAGMTLTSDGGEWWRMVSNSMRILDFGVLECSNYAYFKWKWIKLSCSKPPQKSEHR